MENMQALPRAKPEDDIIRIKEKINPIKAVRQK
jgi:hypothetical protein